ncbi:BglG family transcription antiterminator [Paludifilum halophilum]|uniref:Uncharacterized protein n=1 Tax=Paludifilum halophilum TaxID=1642702 RepID=A0A235B938_9BACL|nr:BglG family transcription antiterminator [Paludifilum halophilum]OYD08818.1 hypothetical protein CHM34_03210 [Paludifilum halophilum]
MIHQRQVKLLYRLLQSDRPISVGELAQDLSCSEKTVRNDLKKAERWVRKHAPLQLLRKPGVGVLIEGPVVEKKGLLRELKRISVESPSPQDPERRQWRLIRTLLEADRPLTARQLANRLYISKASIHLDLDQVEGWLNQQGLQLVRKPNWGVRVKGDEKAWRLALSRITEQLNAPESAPPLKKPQGLFAGDVPAIREAVRRLERSLDYSFTEEAVTNLVTHIAIAIRRIKQGQTIRLPDEELAKLKKEPEYAMAAGLAEQLSRAFAVAIPEAEVGYIAMHLLGAKVRRNDPADRSGDDLRSALEKIDKEAVLLARSLIAGVSEALDCGLREDQTLLLGLALHLHSAVNRIRHGLRLDNPLLRPIKADYRTMFETLLTVLPELEEKWGISFHEEEVAYLTLHFQAALERLHGCSEKKKALLVCTTGMGTSQLLTAKLNRLFPQLRVMDTVATYELSPFLQNNRPDLIISTVPLSETGIPTVRVSPLLTENEQERIRSALGERTVSAGAGSRYPVIRSLLNEERVFLRVKSETGEELLRKMGKELAAAGLTAEAYTDSLLERERLSSTAIGEGIAIPHGDPRHVEKPGMAVASLEQPISWGGEPVWLVFILAFSPEDKKMTQRLFRELVELTDDPEQLKRLKTIQDPSEWVQSF